LLQNESLGQMHLPIRVLGQWIGILAGKQSPSIEPQEEVASGKQRRISAAVNKLALRSTAATVGHGAGGDGGVDSGQQPSETPSWSKLKSPVRALSLRRMSSAANVDGEAGKDGSNEASIVDEEAGEDGSNEVPTQQTVQPSPTASFRTLRSSVLGLSLRRNSSVVPSVEGEAGEDKSDEDSSADEEAGEDEEAREARSNEVQTQQTTQPSPAASFRKLRSSVLGLSLRRNSSVVPSVDDGEAGEDGHNEVQTQQTTQPSPTASFRKLRSPVRALRRMSSGNSFVVPSVDDGEADEDGNNEVQTQQTAQPSEAASFRKLGSSVRALRRMSSGNSFVVPSVDDGEVGEDGNNEVQTQQTAQHSPTASFRKLASPVRALRRMSSSNASAGPSVDGEASEDERNKQTELAAESAYIDAVPDEEEEEEEEPEIPLEDILQAKLDKAEQRLSELEREHESMILQTDSLESRRASRWSTQARENRHSCSPESVNRQDAAQVPPAARPRASSPERWANQESPAKKTFMTTRLRPSDALLSALLQAEQTHGSKLNAEQTVDFKLNVPCLSPMPQQQSICRPRTDQAALDDSSSRSSTRTRMVHERLRMPDSARSSLASRMSVPPSRAAPTSLDTSQSVKRHCARLQLPTSMAIDSRQACASFSAAPATVPPQHLQSTRLQMPQRHAPVLPQTASAPQAATEPNSLHAPSFLVQSCTPCSGDASAPAPTAASHTSALPTVVESSLNEEVALMAMDSPIRCTHAGTPTSATPPRSPAVRRASREALRLRMPDSPAPAPTLSPAAAAALTPRSVLTPRQAYNVAEFSPATAVDPATEEPHLMLTSPGPFPDESPRTPRPSFNPPPAVPPSPAPPASAVTMCHTAHLPLPFSETTAADTPITAPAPAPSNTNDDPHIADAALVLNLPAERSGP